MKMPPANVAGEEGTRRLMQLIRVWSSRKHAHIQFNILNRQSLLDAQKNPEKYRDLVVRVAGYCAYFVDLSPSTIADARNAPIEQLGLVEEVEGVRSLVSPIEWDLLWGVAEGADYEGLSQQVSKPIGTLKSKVARCRRRLRGALDGVGRYSAA